MLKPVFSPSKLKLKNLKLEKAPKRFRNQMLIIMCKDCHRNLDLKFQMSLTKYFLNFNICSVCEQETYVDEYDVFTPINTKPEINSLRIEILKYQVDHLQKQLEGMNNFRLQVEKILKLH